MALDFAAELRRIFEVFDRGGVTYALAGGLAVAIYATPRATEDIDILLAPDHVDRAVAALERLWLSPKLSSWVSSRYHSALVP